MYIHLLYLHTFAEKMKIDEEIKSNFESELHRATVNILFTYNWLNSMHTETLKPFKLSTQQFNVLRILKGQHPKPASVKLIAERMIDKNSNASRLIDKLLDKGYVERKSCEHDRRQVDIVLTEKGLEDLERASQLAKSKSVQLGLNEEEAKNT